MITMHLRGGTGNQLFQYAFGLAQARRLGVELQLDIGGYKTDRMREYTLGLFPRIQNRVIDDNLPVTVRENGMPFNPETVNQVKDGDVIDGYFQTEKYFEDHEIQEELRWLLNPKPLTDTHLYWLRKIQDSYNPTFVTLRRTDYVNNAFHGELPISYYEEALKTIHRLTKEPPDVFVFTDDIEWCQQNLCLPYLFEIAGTYDRTVKGHIGREDADLFLMSRCRNAVMANSSFSWWGAFLGDKDRKGVVIAPQQWFGSASREDPRDIIPDRWIRI